MILFVCHIVCSAFVVSRKFKEVNAAISYSVFRICLTLSFPFLVASIYAYLYTFVIVEKFVQTKDRIEKAIIAAVTPAIAFPITAFAKYIVLRKSSEIISIDRTFVLCYFLRGGSILLYRTMQSGFQYIWLFVGLSLLHGASNILSKATLQLRIKIWKSFLTCFNKICSCPRLELQDSDSPRIRRLNADLEIQNILFEYSTLIVGQMYLVGYLVLSYEVPLWFVIKDSLIKIAISLGIDFVSNIITVFIQIHFYDIPMQRVWQKYWRRHVAANALMIIVFVSYLSTVLLSVFSVSNHTLKEEHKLRNCTSFTF